MPYLAIASAWIATAAAVMFAMWITETAWPLWAMLIPATLSASSD